MREPLLEFIGHLRAAGLRVSVAESLDAPAAVAAAGLEREHLREALAATLVKDQADRPVFEREFERFFRASGGAPRPPRSGRSWQGMSGGHGGGSGNQPPSSRPIVDPRRQPGPGGVREHDQAPGQEKNRSGPARDDAHGENSAQAARERSMGERAGMQPGARIAGTREVLLKPFSSYTDLEYERAVDLLAVLRRRLRVRLGRRRRKARRGQVDFRRTIRAAMQSGGAMLDLRMRARRPHRVDLLILADISGSVHYASTLMLALVAGVEESFRRVRAFVFIDRLAEAGFERGHLTMQPALDLYARSDFGRVLAELITQWHRLLTPATVVVILGDGRNNRRPARSDLLAEIRRLTRAVIWLNPEARERWATGDSAIGNYARAADALIECRNLRDLEVALGRVGDGMRPQHGLAPKAISGRG
jgi:uncharacterized protein with von Willebrand factor type A (vWA) domain